LAIVAPRHGLEADLLTGDLITLAERRVEAQANDASAGHERILRIGLDFLVEPVVVDLVGDRPLDHVAQILGVLIGLLLLGVDLLRLLELRHRHLELLHGARVDWCAGLLLWLRRWLRRIAYGLDEASANVRYGRGIIDRRDDGFHIAVEDIEVVELASGCGFAVSGVGLFGLFGVLAPFVLALFGGSDGLHPLRAARAKLCTGWTFRFRRLGCIRHERRMAGRQTKLTRICYSFSRRRRTIASTASFTLILPSTAPVGVATYSRSFGLGLLSSGAVPLFIKSSNWPIKPIAST